MRFRVAAKRSHLWIVGAIVAIAVAIVLAISTVTPTGGGPLRTFIPLGSLLPSETGGRVGRTPDLPPPGLSPNEEKK